MVSVPSEVPAPRPGGECDLFLSQPFCSARALEGQMSPPTLTGALLGPLTRADLIQKPPPRLSPKY